MFIERKYRILGIAPYENLGNAMVTETAKYEDIKMVIYTGNLEDGVQLALQHTNEGFSTPISRGGTAEPTRKIASIPIIEITLSTNDILHVILLMGNLTEAYVVVGYPTVTQLAHAFCEMMNYRMNIITIYSPDELDPALEEFRAGGCNFTLCNVIAGVMAQEVGVEPILILSGSKSIDIAIDCSIDMCRVLVETKAHSRLFIRVLDMQGMKTVIIEQDGSTLFSIYDEKNISSVTGYLKRPVESLHFMSAEAFHVIENRLYSISVGETTFLEEPCCTFCLEQNPFPVGGSKHGIRFSACTEVSIMYSSSFYSLTFSARLMEEKTRVINQATLPAMILGERGSGKNQLVAKLYLESSIQRYPYITIDCQAFNKRTWDYTISNYNSPLNDRNNTIFISNLQTLSRYQQEQLLSFLADINAHKWNKIIFSCSQTLDRDLPDPFRNFIDYLPCTTVYIPSLRELADDIQGSSSLHLNAMNMEISKQTVGLTPEVLALLMSYRWPDNPMQLKRVLTELAMLISIVYIQRDTVFKVIEKEKRQYIPTAADLSGCNRPLGEMTRETVKVVLSQCGSNQILTVKRLGIGRTTL